MKRRLTRPTAALFPMVGLIAVLVGGAARSFIPIFYLMYYIAQLLSLCAADSFRNAAACEPGMRWVDRRFGGALLCALAGSALALLLALPLRPAAASADPALAADHAQHLYRLILRAGIAAACVNIEHLFEERMFALGRRVDGVILSCICNGLLLAGALLDAGAEATGGIFAISAGLGSALSLITAYMIEPMHGRAPTPNFRFFPRACAQTLLFPAASCALALLLSNGDGAKLDAMLPAILFGLIPWRLARTTARRTPDESRPLNLLLILFAAIPAILSPWLPAIRPFAQMGALSLLCAAAVFCAPSWRLWTGIALIILALLPLPIPLLNAAFAFASILLNLKNAFRRKLK